MGQHIKVPYSHMPLPHLCRSVPYVPPKDVTHPKPFSLLTESRGQQYQTQLQKQLQAEKEKADRARRMHAHPLPISTDIPIVPAKPEPKHPTLPKPFHLESQVMHCGEPW